MPRTALILSLLLLVGCDDSPAPSDAGSTGDDAGGLDAGAPAGLPESIGPAERPARLVAPSAHDGTTPLPLLVLLHGYSANGGAQELYLRLSRQTRSQGFYLVIPEGTEDSRGNQFWNATPACCNFDGSDVDDVAYLMGLVDEMEGLAPIRDVYFFGHSNGGFMSYRMACEHADRITAIGSLAGSGFATEAECGATQPVSVLQIHGDMDETIPYAGVTAAYPSAEAMVDRWAARAGCTDEVTAGDPLDLDQTVAGAETTVADRVTGCSGADASLWTIVGGSHIPDVTSGPFSQLLLEWLDRHRR